MQGKQFATYYHGTNSSNVESILKEGLVPRLPGGGVLYSDDDEGDPGHPAGVYLTKHIDEAREYGDALLEVQVNPKELGYSPENSHEFSPVRIPPDRIKQLDQPDE